MTLSCIVGENRDTKPTQISKKKGERQMGGGEKDKKAKGNRCRQLCTYRVEYCKSLFSGL